MHCTSLYSIAAMAMLAITAQAVPFPTATLARRDAAPSATGAFEKRNPLPTGMFQRREAAPSGIFDKRAPAPTGAVRRRDGAPAIDPPFPQFDKGDEDSATVANCSCTGGKAPIYTVDVPANIAGLDVFGPGCPAQGFVDTFKAGGDPLFGYGCKSNTDGGVTLTFSSAGQIGSAVDLALSAISGGSFPEAAQCQRSQCSSS